MLEYHNGFRKPQMLKVIYWFLPRKVQELFVACTLVLTGSARDILACELVKPVLVDTQCSKGLYGSGRRSGDCGAGGGGRRWCVVVFSQPPCRRGGYLSIESDVQNSQVQFEEGMRAGQHRMPIRIRYGQFGNTFCGS